MGEGAAFGKLGHPNGDVILRAVKCLYGAGLSEGGWVAGAVALDGADGFGNGQGRGSEADAPAGHRICFGEAVHDNGVRLMLRRACGDALEDGIAVQKFFINFIAHDEHAFFHTHIAKRAHFIRRVHAAGGVARGIEDEEPRAVGDGGAELIGRYLEFRSVGGFDYHRCGTGERDHLGIAQPIRRRDNHLVAFLTGGEDHIITGMLAATGNDDLLRIVLKIVFALKLTGHCRAQLRRAGGRGVFGKPIGQCLSGGGFNVLGCVEIRFARAESDHILAGGAQRFGFGGDGESERG